MEVGENTDFMDFGRRAECPILDGGAA